MPLNKNIDRNEAILTRTLKAVDKRIESLVASLASDSNGRFLSDSISIQQALSIRTDIAQAMLPYNNVANDISNSLVESAIIARTDYIAEGMTVAFTDTDTAMIQALTNDTARAMIAGGDATVSAISEAVYTSVATGGSKAEALTMVEQFVLGKTDVRGRPLLNYAATIAEDAYMGAHSTATILLADQANVTEFRFSGTLVGDSRQWCVDHVNKVYTREEIKKWDSQQWQGKKAGDSFIVRGGYRCHHRWTPIAPKA